MNIRQLKPIMKKVISGFGLAVITFSYALTASATFVVEPPSDVLPTTLEECKQDGWEAYLIFKNQGDCVSFLSTDGKNEPALLP
jgi:hypothetical protein